jgi:carboxymethylenebutenolidase
MYATFRRSMTFLLSFVVLSATRAHAQSAAADDYAGHETGAVIKQAGVQDLSLPADGATAQARLAASPRHGEWVMVRTGPSDSVRAWVVYPERRDKAPVIVVVHEIFGLSNWIRAVADKFAADGFIAIAPDLLTTKNLPNAADGATNPDSARAAIGKLQPADVNRQLLAVGEYGMSLPAARKKYGVVGFCWGGGVSFAHAVASPKLGASVVYYGVSPTSADLASVRAPVLGLYGENDARVDATIPPADSAMKALKKTYEPHILKGAGHGFLRAQDGQNGANLSATKEAWPLTVGWFRKYLGR